MKRDSKNIDEMHNFEILNTNYTNIIWATL